MVIYEVTATVAKELGAEFERYMVGQHIPDWRAPGPEEPRGRETIPLSQ